MQECVRWLLGKHDKGGWQKWRWRGRLFNLLKLIYWKGVIVLDWLQRVLGNDEQSEVKQKFQKKQIPSLWFIFHITIKYIDALILKLLSKN